MLTAQIIVDDKQGDLVKLFAPEDQEFPNKRAKYELKNTKGKTTFNVEASDATALRAVLTSITKLIMVYEKAKDAYNG